ncbi:MAG: DUF86 domain-containing protein [Caldibacillus sp.]
MYFVDRKKIEATLQFMERQTETFERLEAIAGPVEKNALERIAHTLIEAILDVGSALIDGFIMRDPGSYHDIIDILTDEKVIAPEMEKPLKQIIDLRKSLVQDYIMIDHEKMRQILTENLAAVKAFPEKVRYFLANEDVAVTAFKPE